MRVFLMWLVIGWAAPGFAQPMTPVAISRTELAPGVHQFTVAADGYVEQLNSVAVIGDDEVLVFDTTTRPSTARTILSEIRKLTSKPVRTVVNSHWHPDHWSGNEVFADAYPALQIVATEQERDFMMNVAAMWPRTMPVGLAAAEKEAADMLASGLERPGVPLTPAKRAAVALELGHIRDRVAEQLKVRRTYPTVTYTDRLTLRRGGREMQLISVTGDAAGTTVLWLPKERILLTGDAVSYPLPYYTPPLSEHARSLRMLASLNPAIIVPGHGPAFRDTSYMMLEAELFEEVIRQTRAALQGGAVTIDDVQARLNFDTLKARFVSHDPSVRDEFDGYAKRMARRAYIELRDSKEIPPPQPAG
jgi:cyclase